MHVSQLGYSLSQIGYPYGTFDFMILCLKVFSLVAIFNSVDRLFHCLEHMYEKELSPELFNLQGSISL